jgi:hypothetical protein
MNRPYKPNKLRKKAIRESPKQNGKMINSEGLEIFALP